MPCRNSYPIALLLGALTMAHADARAAPATTQDSATHMVEIAKGVYSYSPGDHLYSMFVVTPDGVLAIESMNTPHAKGMLAAIRSVTDKPVRFLFHSHNHWDHASGGQVFRDAGAQTVAHAEAAAWMKANPNPDMVPPSETWRGARKDVTVGGVTLELHYLGMNHGLGMTVFLLPAQKVAYIADLVTPNRLMFGIVPDFNIREWERSLEILSKMPFEKAVYSHNELPDALAGGTRAHVDETLAFIRDLRAALFAEMKAGTDFMMVPSTVRLPRYAKWAMYDQWLEMNAWRLLMDLAMGPFPWRPEAESTP